MKVQQSIHVNEWDEFDQHDYLVENRDDFEKIIPKYYPYIGEFLVAFSELEHDLNIALNDYISDRAHGEGYVVIEKLTMKNKIDLFQKMSARRQSIIGINAKRHLRKIIVRLNSINEFRNAVVHANWQSLTPDKLVRTKVSVDSDTGFVKFKRVPMTPRLLSLNTKEAFRLGEDMYEYQEELDRAIYKSSVD